MKVLKSEKWLNKNIAGAFSPLYGKDNGFYGKTHSEETKLIISNANKRKTENLNLKKLKIYEKFIYKRTLSAK